MSPSLASFNLNNLSIYITHPIFTLKLNIYNNIIAPCFKTFQPYIAEAHVTMSNLHHRGAQSFFFFFSAFSVSL